MTDVSRGGLPPRDTSDRIGGDGVHRYAAQRIGFMLVTLWAVTTITFFLSYLVPGDPARLIAGATASHEQVARVRSELGLNRPVPVQYVSYLSRLVRGDLGQSLQTRRPVMFDIREYFAATFELSTVALILTLMVGVPLGVLSAVYRDTPFDHFCRLFSLSGVSLPVFLLAMLLQLVFCRLLGLFPLGGRVTMGAAWFETGLYLAESLIRGDLSRLSDVVSHLVLPTLCVAYPSLAMVTRMMRANMLEVLPQDYVRTSRAFGFPQRTVHFHYALKNALIPTVTIVGLAYGYLLGGSLMAEVIFAWPGLGRYAAFAIMNSDYSAVMGFTLAIALSYMTLNLFIDLSYGLIDPRVRYRG